MSMACVTTESHKNHPCLLNSECHFKLALSFTGPGRAGPALLYILLSGDLVLLLREELLPTLRKKNDSTPHQSTLCLGSH